MFYRRTGRQANIKKIIRQMAEKKHRDTFANWFNNNSNRVAHTGTIISLSDIPQDATDTGRVGDKVTMTSLEIKYSFWSAAANPAATPPELPKSNYILRVIIFIWKDDTTPTLGMILNDDAGATSLEQTVLAPLNHDLKVKRKIIMDETYNANVAISDLGQILSSFKPTQQYRRVFDLTKMRGGLNTINFTPTANEGINKIWMLMVSNADYETVTDPINTTWNIFWRSRVNYVDM